MGKFCGACPYCNNPNALGGETAETPLFIICDTGGGCDCDTGGAKEPEGGGGGGGGSDEAANAAGFML